MKLRFGLPMAVVSGLLGCLPGDRLAGTSHETETGTQLSGILESEDDISDSGIQVYARSAAYVRPEMGAGAERQWADSTRTDRDGRFVFDMDAKDTGAFYVEALRDTGLGLRIPLDGARPKRKDLGARYLGRTGSLSGEIVTPPGDGGTVLIQLLGTSRYQTLDSGAVDFTFLHLPAGAYTGRATGLRPPRGPVEFHAEVPPGGSVEMPALTLETTTGSARGKVALPAGTHGIADVEAVGTGLHTRTDSLGRYFLAGLPAGKIVLRAFGSRPNRDTVETQVTIQPGGLTDKVDFFLHRLAVLLVDGINNHDWARLSPAFRSILETTGMFRVTVSTTPPFGSDSARWAEWRPDFTAYDAVLLDFSDIKDVYGASWPMAAKDSLRSFVAGGGGLVVTQASQSAFKGWEPYREMLGLAWGKPDQYPGAYLDSALALRTVPIGQESSYTVRGEFTIRKAKAAHPITKGVPASWRHAEDGVDLGLRGPAKNMTVLEYMADTVSGRWQPVDWIVAYGKGRVFNTSLGDVLEGGPDTAVRCAGFQTLLARGAEWAAAARVTLPLPKDFPSDTTASIRVEFGKP